MGKCFDVAGKTVLITGAARGIGAALAERMVANGANVALVGLEPDRLAERAAHLGPNAASFEADVTDHGALEDAVDRAVSRFGGIDVAVANAGLAYVGTLRDQPVEQWVRTIDVNLLGVYRTDRIVLPHLVERDGYLLNIASLSAVAHSQMMSAYTASKAGVEAMTDALSIELSPTGAGVGCAYFGFVDTDLVRGAYEHPTTRMMNDSTPGFLKRPIPLSQAIDAIERGIARRARRIWAPWWVGPMIGARSLIQPLAELAGRSRKDQLAEAMRLSSSGADVPPVDSVLGVAVQDGVPAGDHGSAAELVS